MARTSSTKRQRRWRDYWRLAFRGRNSPEQVARGVVIGLMIAFTPLLGIHLPLVLLLATVFNASRVAAIPPVFITNLVTMVPIFTFTYYVGAVFLPGPAEDAHRLLSGLKDVWMRHQSMDMTVPFREALKMSGEVLLAMCIGGLIVGGLVSAVAYPLTLRVVRRHRRRRAERLRRRRHEAGLKKEHPEAGTPPDSR